ncbi:MAG TPA: hypothetical protein VJH22_05285 [Candidatus Nanoarchaeia archaeon]|nr:hypothetical protein [Candidatus Nanoarchaeia archaeon]
MSLIDKLKGFFDEKPVPSKEHCGVIYLGPLPIPSEELPLVKELHDRLSSYGDRIEIIKTYVPWSPGRSDLEKPPFVRPGQIIIVRPTPVQTDPVTFRLGLHKIVEEYEQHKGRRLKKTQVQFYEATAFF